MIDKQWEFTGETKICFGITLKRIRATVGFRLKYGGVISKGELGGWIEKESNLSGDAEVKSSKDYSVYKNTWSSFRRFTYTRSNKMWRVGCFYGTGAELIAKAYKDSEKSGKCYEAIVKAQEEIEKVMEV